ncbi:MAG: M48 family metallopeptidase [Halobacteriovoraceae bacterium]|nr:M48 family metallopeptidase [Halobacteriovoraceae bacterium]
MSTINYSTITDIFLSFLMAKYLAVAWLNYRNKKHIKNHQDRVPQKFQQKISLEEHQKAARYSIAKIKTGEYFGFLDFIVLMGWTLFGGLQYLDTLVVSQFQNEIIRGIVFFTLMGLISLIIDIPQSLYSTFVLEEKFGFNKTTPKTFVMDLVKSIIISTLIGLPVLSMVLWILQLTKDSWWIYAWGFLTVIQLVLIWLYPRVIAPWFNKFTPLSEGELKTKILNLLERTGFASKGIFVMDASRRSTHGNAYFTGLGKNKRIVFFDTLINNLEDKEVEAVLAHELGHFKKKHILKSLVMRTAFSFIGFALLGFLYQWLPFYQGHGVDNPSGYMALALFSMVGSAYTFFLTPLINSISRKHEYQADRFAAEHAEADRLISALVKLHKDNASTLTPDPLYSAFYYSHPPTMARTDFLEKCK